MLPEDTDWFDNSGNEPITHDWTNTVQRSVDLIDASSSTATYPSPTGTTLPFGGGKILLWQYGTGLAAGAAKELDSTFDARYRFIRVFAAGAYNAANKLPGEANYPGNAGMGFDYDWTTGTIHYTENGATAADPPAGGANYLTLDAGGDFFLFADSANNGYLTLYNATAATTVYPFIVVLVSDQFDVRSP